MYKHRISNGLLLGALVIGSLPHVQALTYRERIGVLVAGAGLVTLGTWVYIKHLQKERITRELAQVQSELNGYKTDRQQLENDQKYAAAAASFVSSIERDYAQELALMQRPGDIDGFLRVIGARLASYNTSMSTVISSVQRALETALEFHNELLLKLRTWTDPKRTELKEFTQDTLLPHLQSIQVFLHALYAQLQSQEHFISFSQLLAKDYEQLYACELTLAGSLYNASHARNLDRHIKGLYAQDREMFPYMRYAQQLQKDLGVLKGALRQVPASSYTQVQQELVKRGQSLVEVLASALDYATNSSSYAQETERKPVYEREQRQLEANLRRERELHEAQLRERAARADNEARLAQAQFDKQRNKQNKLEQARKELDVKERAVRLEYDRLRSGEERRQALEKNDNQWGAKYSKLEAQYAALQSAPQVNQLTGDIDKLKAEIKNLRIEIDHNKAERDRYKDKLARAHTSIQSLKNQLKNPPLSPDTVSGLARYTESLLDTAHIVETILE